MSTTTLEAEEKTAANKRRNILYEFAKQIFEADTEWLKKMCREEVKATDVTDRNIRA